MRTALRPTFSHIQMLSQRITKCHDKTINFFPKVLCCNPVSGDIVRQVDLPVAKVTSCCWGGPNLDELYVTCER